MHNYAHFYTKMLYIWTVSHVCSTTSVVLRRWKEMVRVGDVYKQKTNFLSVELVEKLGLWEKALKIGETRLQKIRDRDKIVLELLNENNTYLLPLNRTNAIILAEAFGDETETWNGKEIKLYKVKRAFQGKLVDAIEVKPVVQKKIKT